MSAWAKPGVECVCVHRGPWRLFEAADPGAPIGADLHPGYGEVCRIDHIRRRRSGETSVILSGYSNNEYRLRWFKPIAPAKGGEDDIEIFRHHLNTVEEPA